MLALIYIALWLIGIYHAIAFLGLGVISKFLIFSRFGLFRIIMRPKETGKSAAKMLRNTLRHGVIATICVIGIILFNV